MFQTCSQIQLTDRTTKSHEETREAESHEGSESPFFVAFWS